MKNESDQQTQYAAADRQQHADDLGGVRRAVLQKSRLRQSLLELLPGGSIHVRRRDALGGPSEKHAEQLVVLKVAFECALRSPHPDRQIRESFIEIGRASCRER